VTAERGGRESMEPKLGDWMGAALLTLVLVVLLVLAGL
jgi:hypothetical protein